MIQRWRGGKGNLMIADDDGLWVKVTDHEHIVRAAQILLRFWYMDHCGGLNYCECGVCKETRDFLKDVRDGD